MRQRLSTGSLIAALAGAALMVAPRAGLARSPLHSTQTPSLNLSWIAPAECPTAAEVVADVLRLRAWDAPLPPLQAAVEVARGSSGAWSVSIRTVSEAGTSTRSMAGESCAALAQAAALYLALALEASGAVSLSVPEPTDPSAPKDPPSIVVPGDATPLTARARTFPDEPTTTDGLRHLSLAASLRVDSATLPRPVGGAELSAAWRAGALRLEAAGTYWFQQRDLLLQAPAAGGDFSMISAALRICTQFGGGSFAIGPCLAFNVDHVHANGYGAFEIAGGSTTWPGGALGGIAAWRFVRWGMVRATADADAPFARPRFIVVNSDAQHRPAAVSMRLGIGVELGIP
jgi:hypothetical protein